jgi:hypothetical protein
MRNQSINLTKTKNKQNKSTTTTTHQTNQTKPSNQTKPNNTKQPSHNPTNQQKNTNQPNQKQQQTSKTNHQFTVRIMMKLSPTAFALLVATASRAPAVSAQDWSKDFPVYGTLFVSCPNAGDFYQGVYSWAATTAGFCTQYPGQPLAPPKPAAASVPAASDLQSLNGWSCFPEGASAECPAGFAIADVCMTPPGAAPKDYCQEYCSTPSFFAVKCVPSPITDVPLNSGEWLPTVGTDHPAYCDDGSVLCGLCTSSNPSDCQGVTSRGKCCK